MILVDGIPAAAIGRRMIELGLAQIIAPTPEPQKVHRGKRYDPKKHAEYMRDWRAKRTKSRTIDQNELASAPETLILSETQRSYP